MSTDRWTRRLAALVAAVLVAMIVGACGGGGDDDDADVSADASADAKAKDDSGDEKSDDESDDESSSSSSDDDKVKIETKDGTFEAGGTDLPDDWPKDFPVPDGAKITVSSTQSGNDGASAMTVGFSVKDDAKDVFDFYVKELDDAGYEIENKMSGGSGGDFGASLAFKKGDTEGSVIIGEGSGEDGGTGINVTLVTK